MTKAVLPRFFLLILIWIMACAPLPVDSGPEPVAAPAATFTPFQPGPASATEIPNSLWVDPLIPEKLRVTIKGNGVLLAESKEKATIWLESAPKSSGGLPKIVWHYALVAAFPTVRDGIAFSELKAAWNGNDQGLLMTESTYGAMKTVFGGEASPGVEIVPAAGLTEALWQNRSQWGIVPFEQLNPKLKVLEIDGQSPVHKEFDPESYPLKAFFRLNPPVFALPPSNRDPEKLTTVLMTGTTALVRAISFKMQQNGVYYPAGGIGAWLRGADILHISNEVSFTPDCPPPALADGHLRFCSAPDNIGLLEAVGADVIELTGNHLNDWGQPALLGTLEMYRQRGWATFGGGVNEAAARQPAMIERGGVKFAFLGCNAPGPDFTWATADGPGAAPCDDYDWLVAEIRQLKAEGCVVMVGLQHYEYYTPEPRPNQLTDFRRLAEAGADVVSGSQAHYSQALEFSQGAFIHYGLGNLFFDQMGYDYADGSRTTNTRREFLDRHVFYDGKLVSAELLTAMLEDYSRPRPMTAEERESFLKEYFAASGW